MENLSINFLKVIFKWFHHHQVKVDPLKDPYRRAVDVQMT